MIKSNFERQKIPALSCLTTPNTGVGGGVRIGMKASPLVQMLLYNSDSGLPSWGTLLTNQDVSSVRPLAAQNAERRPIFQQAE